MNGVYHYADDDGDVGTWVIRTSCTPDCVAHVTTAANRGFDAQFVDGHYQVTRVVPEGHICPPYSVGDMGGQFPGGAHPVTVFQWWDPVTLSGEVDFLESEAPCGLHDLRDSFTLTKIG